MKDEDKTKEQLIKELIELRQEAQKRRAEFSAQIKSALQEDFKNREERYRTAAQSVSNAIISVDRNGDIIFLNNAAKAIYGYSAEEVLGRPLTLMIPERFREVYQNGMKQLILTGEADIIGKTVEMAGLRKDGSEFPVEIYLSAWKNGEEVFFTGNIRDITEIKQAENKLQMAAIVFENTAEGLMVITKKGVIQSVNPAFCRITGYSEEEVIGKFPCLLESEVHVARFDQAMWSSKTKAGLWRGEIWLKRKCGEIFPAWLSISAIKDEQGQIVQYVDVFSDITEQVRLREERRQFLEQAARSQRLASLGTMSAGIAHEINQPLNSLKVIADGMLYWHKRGHSLEPEKVMENLQKISSQAGRIDEIIKHMRSFVNTRRATELEPCSIVDAVNGALGMLGRQLSSHGIVVKKILSGDLPPVLGNPNRLEEVAVNLLVNAMQALDTVERTDKEISLSARLEGEKVILEVNDNATGVSNEIKDSIFEPFFSTKKTGEGMGLGLSIVQSIVSSCNGEIKVRDNEKGGATFRVELPAIDV